MEEINIKNRNLSLIEKLIDVWKRSVRETHLFLSNEEIEEIKNFVPMALKSVPHLIIENDVNGVPIAFMGIDDGKLEMLFIDPRERGKGLGRKLLEHGARSLAYVGSHSKYPNGTMLRRDGFRDYLENIGIDYKEIFLQEPVNDFTPYILEMLKVHPKIDGIFCHTDSLLLKLRKILNQYGYRVPEDIQLIGFDGMNLSSDLPLGISTIAQPVEQLANGAVDLVLRKIADPSLKNEAKMYPVKYVDGNTTK